MRRRNTIASVFKTDKNDENKHEYKRIPPKKRLKLSKINGFRFATFRTFIGNVAMMQPLNVRKKRSKIVPASARVITLYFLVGLCII